VIASSDAAGRRRAAGAVRRGLVPRRARRAPGCRGLLRALRASAALPPVASRSSSPERSPRRPAPIRGAETRAHDRRSGICSAISTTTYRAAVRSSGLAGNFDRGADRAFVGSSLAAILATCFPSAIFRVLLFLFGRTVNRRLESTKTVALARLTCFSRTSTSCCGSTLRPIDNASLSLENYALAASSLVALWSPIPEQFPQLAHRVVRDRGSIRASVRGRDPRTHLRPGPRPPPYHQRAAD
jgi:hypothetical protein